MRRSLKQKLEIPQEMHCRISSACQAQTLFGVTRAVRADRLLVAVETGHGYQPGHSLVVEIALPSQDGFEARCLRFDSVLETIFETNAGQLWDVLVQRKAIAFAPDSLTQYVRVRLERPSKPNRCSASKQTLLQRENTMNFIKTFAKDEKGADMVEYALIIGLVALGALAAFKGLGTQLTTSLTTIKTSLSTNIK